uniref:DDE Tnp4 domain-containing protein n=1 Tax=Cyprinodon variegatus TaxID=28743 RepID=A0A3Q2G3V4_CYPVA
MREETFNPQQWIENFRMSYRTFKWLCESLRPHVSKAETKMPQPIPVEQKVGAVLWFLGTTSDYRTIAHLFGISRASLCIFVKDVCEAICFHLTPQFIKLPTDIEARNITESFKEKWGYPTCIGAIDGSHIPIVAPKESRVDYFNRKGWYSINMQALVDDRYMFRDLCIGWPGSTHDAHVLVNSHLYQFWENGVFPHLQTEIDGVMVPPVILGDPAYPLLPWLMKPYPEYAGTTEAQKNTTSSIAGDGEGEDFLEQLANEANQQPRNNLVDGDNNPDINNAHNIRNTLYCYFSGQY